MTTPKFFFIHVMKTGGTTFRSQAISNFAPDEIFPRSDEEMAESARVFRYLDVAKYVGLSPELKRSIRFFTGHVPFATADLTCPDAIKIAILREPVARTISYLRHCQNSHIEHRTMPLEEIYEDPWFFPRYIENHQTKIFSMTDDETMRGQEDPVFDHLDPHLRWMRENHPDDPTIRADLERKVQAEGWSARTLLRLADRAPTEVVVVDDQRLAQAKANVDQLDVVGVTEHLATMLDEMSARFGWRRRGTPPQRRSWSSEVPESFRRLLAADNAADLELYRHARRRCGFG